MPELNLHEAIMGSVAKLGMEILNPFLQILDSPARYVLPVRTCPKEARWSSLGGKGPCYISYRKNEK